MKVTGNKILVKQLEVKSKSGIISPLAKQGMAQYEVVEVGPGEYNPFTGKTIEMIVKKGDKIVADATLAPEISIVKAGVRNKYNIISVKDIQTILEPDEEIQ